ncbi:hypothetical protein A1O7_00720, partial [Cladophialophora yegresii CBS 114405]
NYTRFDRCIDLFQHLKGLETASRQTRNRPGARCSRHCLFFALDIGKSRAEETDGEVDGGYQYGPILLRQTRSQTRAASRRFRPRSLHQQMGDVSGHELRMFGHWSCLATRRALNSTTRGPSGMDEDSTCIHLIRIMDVVREHASEWC